MYTLSGGCSSLLHLAIQFPALVLALTLSGFISQVPSNPGPGDRLGTQTVLVQVQDQIIKSHPDLMFKVVKLRADFDRLNAQPTEDQVRQVLHCTDACTDVSAKDVLSDPDERREAAWLLYLDTYSREGSTKAVKLFIRGSPPKK